MQNAALFYILVKLIKYCTKVAILEQYFLFFTHFKQKPMQNNLLTVGLAQIAPIWLNREATVNKIVSYINKASEKKCDLVTFGESFLPGYPFWVERTNGAAFNSQLQKEFFAYYSSQAVQISAGHLDVICQACKNNQIATVVGIIERPEDRGGQSLYCALVYIDKAGEIQSVHRKLMPTYEERLVWSPGDGNGLVAHQLNAFTVGGLNCWENWMPLARAALYAQGVNLHVAIWPGGYHNTFDLTKHIAKESRSFVISVSGLMRKSDIIGDIPHKDLLEKNCPEWMANGGSCLAAPNGGWIIVATNKSSISTAIGVELVAFSKIDTSSVMVSFS